MISPTIVINGKTFTHEQIVNEQYSTTSNFEKTTLAFCRDWLIGEKTFHFTTSGSTGIPKSISFSRDQLTSSAQMTANVLGLKHGYTSLVCLDTQYIAGRMMLVRSFVTGMNILAVEPAANPLAQVEDDVKIDFAAFVPYQLRNILASDPKKFNKIGVSIIGGGEIDPSLKANLLDFQTSSYATYGMTETISHIALMRLTGREPQNYFQALPGIRLKKDARSCLVIDVPFVDDPVITNDLVEMISEKEFKWLGRIDNIINSGGVKIVPEEVESALGKIFHQMGWPHRFFIAGIPDSKLGQKICLFIEGDSAPSNVVDELLQKIKQQVSRFEVPKDIRFVKSFQETKTGKINRIETINLSSAKLQ